MFEARSLFISLYLNGAIVEKQLRKLVSSGARMDGLLNISFEQYASLGLLTPPKRSKRLLLPSSVTSTALSPFISVSAVAYENIKKRCWKKCSPKNGADVPEGSLRRIYGSLGTAKLGSWRDFCQIIRFQELNFLKMAGYRISIMAMC